MSKNENQTKANSKKQQQQHQIKQVTWVKRKLGTSFTYMYNVYKYVCRNWRELLLLMVLGNKTIDAALNTCFFIDEMHETEAFCQKFADTIQFVSL